MPSDEKQETPVKAKKERLSKISTCWTRVRDDGPGWVLVRYRFALLPYLRKLLENKWVRSSEAEAAAEDLLQDLALKLTRDHLLNAEQGMGLRPYLKACLRNSVADFLRKKNRGPRFVALPDCVEIPDDGSRSGEAEPSDCLEDKERELEERRKVDARTSDCGGPDIAESISKEAEDAASALFDQIWGNDLIQKALSCLEKKEKENPRRPVHTVFRLRLENVKMQAPELAQQASARLGRSLTSGNIRKLLMDARRWFCRRLLNETAQAVELPTMANLVKELDELGLLGHCRKCIEKWQRAD